MKLDEGLVVLYAEGNGAAGTDGHNIVDEARIGHVEVRYGELNLDYAGEVYEVYFGLERRITAEPHTHYGSEDREVCGLDGVVVRTFDKVLHGAVLLPVDEDCRLAVLYAQRRAVADAVLARSGVCLLSFRAPFPYKIFRQVAAYDVHHSAALAS